MKITNKAEFIEALKTNGFTTLGCYPLYFITSDGEPMSFDYAKENFEQICSAIEERSDCGWRIVACDVNWESRLYCCGNGKFIESAYDPIN